MLCPFFESCLSIVFDGLKKYKFDVVVSPDPVNLDEEDTVDRLSQVTSILRNEVDPEGDSTFLEAIEEKTEEELAQEAFNLERSDCEDLTIKIKIVLIKGKKIVTTFNLSNNLSRELLNFQKENAPSLLSDNSKKKLNCVLQLIQDTRLF